MPDDVLAELAQIFRDKKVAGKPATINVTSISKDLLQTSGNKPSTCGLTIAIDFHQGGAPGCQGGFVIQMGDPAPKIGPSSVKGQGWSVTKTLKAPPTKPG